MKKRSAALGLVVCMLFTACARTPVETTPVETSSEPSPQAIVSTAVPKEIDSRESAFLEQTKAYLLTGQEELPEAGRLHWSPSFLNAADLQSIYEAYRKAGGQAENVEAFATYLTQNAVAPENWQALFEKDLLGTYSQTVDHYEALDDGIYQVYVMLDGKVVPYVAVDSRTGWYHG